MASRYWVGGAASWDGTAGTKWATTSGGAGGASVPTSADDVYFDANSGAVTVTVATVVPSCRNLDFTGFTGTFAGGVTININGSLTAVAGMTWSFTAPLEFRATSGSFQITSAGKTFGQTGFGFGGVSTAVWTLQDAFVSSSSITVTSGTFTTNNYNVTATQLSSSNTNTRTINLGSSTVALNGSGTQLNFSNTTGLTFNAGTSTITSSGTATPTFVTGGVTFNNVSFTNAGAGTAAIAGAATINNLSVAAPSTAGVTQVTFDSPTRINGTLSTTGTAGNKRVWFRGTTYGLAQTLTINSAPSLTDADFRDIYVIGTAAPISGTRIGDLRGCRGITFSTPKTVYWATAGGGSWSGNNWAATSGGGVSTDNFPLAQDTAVIENTGLNTGASVATPSSGEFLAVGTLDASARTLAMTLTLSISTYYGDFTLGSGVTLGGSNTSTFSGRNTQTITSAGKTFPTSAGITIDSYGGTVQLADALNIGSNTLTVTNGTFSTQNYNVTAGILSSSNSNVRAINLGSSTVTLSNTVVFSTPTNLTLNAGTSTLVISSSGSTFQGSTTVNLTFYNVSFTSTTATTSTTGFSGTFTFNNLTIAAPSSAGLIPVSFSANQTITGTLTCAGASAVRRIFLRSNTLGTTRTLTVNSLSADDCDFRDITIAGTAAGASPTRAGDCGGNTGITFPSPKTVYWNLAGAQNWSATAWATSSGGSPDINNFPLAQDTAVFDNTGSVTGTITVNAAWNIGTFDASARTSSATITIDSLTVPVYGNWKFGTGITFSTSTGALNFLKQGTQTITSNGISFGVDLQLSHPAGIVQLADAMTLDSTKGVSFNNSATFDAVSYNVTVGTFTANVTNSTVKMGSGTWTLSGTGTVWNFGSIPLFKGTANIVLSNTSTSARTFAGAGLSYNKLTIGGTTGTSTLTITGNNQFTELASTKTVAHTIALGTTTQTFGAWTVTGTAGNVVTVTGTGTSHVIAGARVTGVDYLAMGTIGFSATSPGEFYAGANSTGSNATIIKTAAPTPVTRYWVGGTGTWDATTTTNWSATSGGAGGASVPTSADAVVFDSLSNATAYTVTCTATQLRCASLTMAGPLVGNVTWAGSAPLAIHDNVSLAATGITRTYTGAITLSGSTTGKTFTTNGVTISSNNSNINGVGCGWSLGGALNDGGSGSTWYVRNGSFDTAGYAVTLGSIASTNNGNTRTLTLGSSTVTIQAFPEGFTNNINLTINPDTSTIVCTATSPTFNGGGFLFNNVSFNSTSAGTVTLNGANTFNNLSVTGITSSGLKVVSLTANQTINGTLTLSAGTNATCRTFVRSDTIGTTRTLTCAAVASLTDIDFRDITIAGAAAPVSGTRLGDCKGNSGITFDAPKTVYYAVPTGNNWGGTSWSFTNGGSADVTAFPLAQDTAVFPSSPTVRPGSGGTASINAAYNIGTIDMSARTSNTMTLATSTNTPTIYGNWINGTGTTLSGTGTLTFAGRGSQTITSAGKTFTQSPIIIDSPNGSVTIQDAITISAAGSVLRLRAGTFDANGYSVTVGGFDTSAGLTTQQRTLAIGSGTWLVSNTSTNAWNITVATTVTGTGTISLTSASAKTFAGGNLSYSGITLDQGGAGALTITGNNTFKDITNSYSATGATNITIGTTTQTVTQFTATGAAGKVLTIQGTSASSPGTLILTSGTVTTPDYLAITGVLAYSLTDTWYAGANSTNNGSLGWYFQAGVGPSSLIYYGSINVTSIYYGSTPVTAIYYGSTKVF